jgi:hypothetical protein
MPHEGIELGRDTRTENKAEKWFMKLSAKLQKMKENTSCLKQMYSHFLIIV